MEEMPSKYTQKNGDGSCGTRGHESRPKLVDGLLYLFPVQLRQGMDFIELSSFREAFVTGTGDA